VARHREAVAQTPHTPFVDALPLPRRILANRHDGELTVPIRAATHRFHRDLPASRVWAYDGRVPGPTIEAERGRRPPATRSS
jgi:spore coat protein A